MRNLVYNLVNEHLRYRFRKFRYYDVVEEFLLS